MNRDWSDIALLEDYLDGKLDGKTMHQVEKQALEDPFVAQALAGLSESRGNAGQSVSLLQKQLYERIAQHQEGKKTKVLTWQRLSVGAAAAVMFITVSIIFVMREKQHRQQLAGSKPKQVEVSLAPVSPSADTLRNEPAVQDTTALAAAVPVKKDQPVTTAAPAAADRGGEIYRVAAAKAVDTAAAPGQGKSPKVAAARLSTVMQALSAPIGGWAALDSYISDHNQLKEEQPAGKLVELSFIIDTEGRPADLKVEKSAGQEFDDEAVRLIKDGPKWELPKAEGRIRYTVGF